MLANQQEKDNPIRRQVKDSETPPRRMHMMPCRSESSRKATHTEMPIRKATVRNRIETISASWGDLREGGCEMLVLTKCTGVWQFFKN